MPMLTKAEGPNEHGNKIYTFAGQYSFEVPAKYEVKRFVGRGAYGIVCSALDTSTGNFVAIKKIGRLFEDTVDGKRVLREVKLLASLNHPNVLNLKDLFHPPHANTFSDLYVVTELMETDMLRLLRAPRTQLKAGHCQYSTLQLLCALQYVHSAGVLHRDLKPSNLLMDAECNLKLCDFGLARGRGDNMTKYVVTRWYRPPELLLVCSHYDYSVDMWGVGCLAAEMVTGKPLFAGHDYINQINLITELLGVPNVDEDLPTVSSPEALHYIKSLPNKPRQSLAEFAPDLRRRFTEASFFDSFDESAEVDTASEPLQPEDYYKQFENFLFNLLTYNPTRRLTAKQAVAHPWLRDVRGDQTELKGCEANKPFHWLYDNTQFTTAQLRQLFVEEVSDFRSRGCATTPHS